MIDFRYHLVSIVSIFLALAVGIVLGSGPLKETLGNQLTDEVKALRASKAQLNGQLGSATKGNETRDSFTDVVTPALVDGRLSGKTVAMVVLPAADAGTIKRTTKSLTSAGAKIGSTVILGDSWADPAKQDFRTTLVAQLAAAENITPVATELLPGTVLAKGILSTGGRTTQRTDATTSQALDGLKAGGLLTYTPSSITLSSSVVVVGAPVGTLGDKSAAPRVAAYVDLTRALDAASAGAVVVEQSNKADPTSPEGLVSAVRSDASSAKTVATVDDGELPMGQVAVVLALREQYAGGSGAYGLANDATAPVPELTGS
jgi:hypothetical protein